MKRVINIVEDEKDINNLVAQYLRKEGYEVHSHFQRNGRQLLSNQKNAFRPVSGNQSLTVARIYPDRGNYRLLHEPVR